MRVAMVSPLFESVPPLLYGGTERVVANLCRGLAKKKIDVTLFASGDSTHSGELVPIVREALRLRKTPVVDPYAYNFKMLAVVAERSHEFDIIHNHHDYWMLPLSKMTSTPVISTLHGRLDGPDFDAAFLPFSNSLYVSISDSQRIPLPQLNWLRTIYHGINVDEVRFFPNPGKYLAFLGRISVEKKPEWAIQIAKLSGVPLKIAAKIEGKVGQDYYDQFVKPHVDGRFIEYIGEISDREKSEFLGNALALTFPIDWPEPFGLVIIEALACGTPVLARPLGSVPELLVEGTTGFMDLSIRVLADSVGKISSLKRQNCRNWAEKKFSIQRMTEDYIDVYRHAISTRYQSDRHRRNFLYPVQRSADGNS